jgi:hypothetical protein
MCEGEHSDREQVARIKPRSSPDQLRVMAAVSANVVEFFKKNSALTEVYIN